VLFQTTPPFFGTAKPFGILNLNKYIESRLPIEAESNGNVAHGPVTRCGGKRWRKIFLCKPIE